MMPRMRNFPPASQADALESAVAEEPLEITRFDRTRRSEAKKKSLSEEFWTGFSLLKERWQA